MRVWAELFAKSRTAKIDRRMQARILARLDALNEAEVPSDVNLPGFDLHELSGDRAGTYSIHVNGPWCITFQFEEGDAVRVNFEQCH